MAFPWTLQRYIIREMSKTFVLTALGLTAVIALGGGVLNLVKIGGELTPTQLFRLIWLVIPIAASLTLPMAALFSATTAYGRLAGDNEFIACRSGGINMHVLLLPTLVLSFICAVATFFLSSSVIPRLIRNLDTIVTADVGTLALQWLNKPGGIKMGDAFVARADAVAVNPENPNEVIMYRAAFAEPKGDKWQRYGTAEEIRILFNRSDGGGLNASATMVGGLAVDPRSGQLQKLGQLEIKKERIEELFPQQVKNKFLTLGELLYFIQKPGEWRDVRLAMGVLRSEVAKFLARERMWQDWQKDHEFVITTSDAEYKIKAQNGRQTDDGKNLFIDFVGVNIDVKRANRRESIKAERATLEFALSENLSDLGTQIDVYEATMSDGKTQRTSAREQLGPLPVRSDIIDLVTRMSNQEMLDVSAQVGAPEPLSKARGKADGIVGIATRRLIATVHERAAFSASVFVLVILGAVLATVLRGSHVVTSFGISFIPSALIITMIVMGKQMTNNAGTHVLGLAVMWGGILLVAIVDWWTLTRVLRR